MTRPRRARDTGDKWFRLTIWLIIGGLTLVVLIELAYVAALYWGWL